MSYQVRQKDIRNMLNCKHALPLIKAKDLIDSGLADYSDFRKVCYSAGIYGINGVLIENIHTGQYYAEACRSSLVFIFA